jgi:hypothetical protein
MPTGNSASEGNSMPASLLPQNVLGALAPLRSLPGIPQNFIAACREQLLEAARPYGVMRMDASSAGRLRPVRGGQAAPLQVRIIYARRGGPEVRQANVNCIISADGAVTLS